MQFVASLHTALYDPFNTASIYTHIHTLTYTVLLLPPSSCTLTQGPHCSQLLIV